MLPNVGDIAPDFTSVSDSGDNISLSSFRGKKVVLYFYPKDNTPGCTREACDFRDHMEAFTSKDSVILGVSLDSAKSHQNFKAKHGLPFSLIADSDKEIASKYGVFVEKMNYGRTYMGIARTTFLIDGHGKIEKIYNKIKVPGHVESVLADI